MNENVGQSYTMSQRTLRLTLVAAAACLSAAFAAEPPPPTLDTVFPPGAAAGSTVTLEVTGKSLTGLKSLIVSIPEFRSRVIDATHVEVAIPESTPAGVYDIWAVSDNGVTSPRTFSVSRKLEILEAAGNDSPESAAAIPLNCIVNGRIEAPGDLDFFRFDAAAGQRIVFAYRAERIDSRLRAVLEIFDARGRRLAANRGYDGIDPLFDFRAPETGSYIVKLFDLVYSGSLEHDYRLELDAGPRIAFTVPNVVERGRESRIKVFGWNLASPNAADGALDEVEVDIPASAAQEVWPLPLRLESMHSGIQGFAYHHPGCDAPVLIGVTDVPVHLDADGNHVPSSAQIIPVPCEVSGQWAGRDEHDWYAIEAKRGEVLHLEILSQRLRSPADPQLSLWDAAGETLLAEWNDEANNIGGVALPTSHLDPTGRWVAPADGRYLLLTRNLRDESQPDPRRTYRFSVRREVPDFQLVVVNRSAVPTGFNVPAGGRMAFDVIALRQRGINDSIRVFASDLPTGVDCPEIFLGPGVERAVMVVSAASATTIEPWSLRLNGHAASTGERPVRASTVVRAGRPNGWSRLTANLPMIVAGEAPARITARVQNQLDHHLYGKLKLRYTPGSVLDVAVTVDRRDTNHRADVKLIGVGLPPQLSNQTVVIPAGSNEGVLSFALPPTLPVGAYSFAVAADTTVPAGNGAAEPVQLISNPATFVVEPAAVEVAVDPFTPRRVRRGQTFEVKYTATRKNGFIGKIHTELASPGIVTNVPGLRGRGETFTGQTEDGKLQVVVNDAASLGVVPFLRLFSVGTVEDQPIHFSAAMFPLEIVE